MGEAERPEEGQKTFSTKSAMESAAASMVHADEVFGSKRKQHPGDGDASEADGASDAGGSDASGAHDVETRATQTASSAKKSRKSVDGDAKKQQRKAPQKKKATELCAQEADAIVSNAKEIRQLTPAEVFNVVMSGQLKVLSIDGKPYVVVVSDQSVNLQLMPGTSVKLDLNIRGLCPLAPAAEIASFEVDKQAVDKMLAPFRKASVPAAAASAAPATASLVAAAASLVPATASLAETQTMV